MKTYEEAGVIYVHNDPEKQLVFTEYFYTAWYLRTDDKFDCSVWVIGGRNLMLELINSWNNKDPKRWHYIF